MLIHFRSCMQVLSRFVKTMLFEQSTIVHSVVRAFICGGASGIIIISCQSAVRFSSHSSPHNTTRDATLADTYSHRLKSRASSQTPSMPDEYRNYSQERLKAIAERWLGVPYRYGSTSRAGTDCSGFVMRVFEESGIGTLPRSTKDQFTLGEPVQRENLRTGDLLFFNTNGIGVSHVGLYIGQDSVIHASSKFGVVKQSLSETYLARTFIGARRVMTMQ